MPDPILKTAAAEIGAILEKHDIAGVVMLSSPTHLEYITELSPSWSCCRWEQRPDGKVLRIKALRADFPTKEAHETIMRDSVGLVLGLLDLSRSINRNLEMVAHKLAAVMDINHITREEPRTPEDSN